jgi:choline dehydrogenase-like flavoprotein
MAATKDAGVVDCNLRVFEAENLYIADSFVFPTNGWVNPTLSIIAISMRLANHLDEKLS